MFSKINFIKIITDHLNTLRNNETNTISILDLLMFFLTPAIPSYIFFYFNIFLSENLVNILIAAFSIFVGLLLNLLMLVYDIVNKNHDTSNIKNTRLKRKFLRQIFSNISYTVFISIITIVTLLFTFPNNGFIKCISTLLSVYLMTQFLLMLLMILKRVHILLSKEFTE